MMPQDVSIKEFNYSLPQERIAQFPLAERDQSKLLIYRKGSIFGSVFSSLPQQLTENDLLIFNQTRVVNARLFFFTESGARIEIFCLSPANSSDVASELQKHDKAEWTCLVGNARKWKEGAVLTIKSGTSGNIVEARLAGREEDAFKVVFSWNDSEMSFGEILEEAGTLPIPPYLNRNPEEDDELRYQTIYAEADGSVAAPTAGLHFTPGIFSELKSKEIAVGFLTLHVGAGTFKPVKAETMASHTMHREEVSVSLKLIEQLADASGNIVAVGTTSLRTLESLYWTGLRLEENPEAPLEINVGQWEPYSHNSSLPSVSHVMNALALKLKNKGLSELRGHTRLLILPGYTFRMTDVLITNFHQPESTLLLLVSAFVGDDWRRIYDYALKNDFRFLSFGDSSILFRNK